MNVSFLNNKNKYEFLLRINNALATQTNSENLFSSLANEIRDFINYDRLTIYIMDQNTKTISYFAKSYGIIPDGMNNIINRPLEKTHIAHLVISTRCPVIIEDLRRYKAFSNISDMLNSGLISTMAFPLINRNKILGTMHLSFKKIPQYFSSLSVIINDLSKQVAIAVDNMLAHTQLQILNENIQLQKRCLHAKLNNYHNTFVFCSEKMNSIFEQASMIAESDVPILITGETGTGKELLAQHIHDLSLVRENLFIKVNCPALPTSLFESELFGHEKGSFTGAYAARIGRFEMAHGGSIFLDEIGDLPLPLQAKLLQVLQDGTFERVGTSKSIKAEFRIISATNQNLQDAINKGQFRKDLYYRLSTITLNLPPLRERTEDIPFLVEHFNSLEVKRTGSPPLLFDPSAIDTLCHYTWPGNVRELKNFVKKMFLLMPAMTLKGSNISKHLGNNGNTENREFHELHEREKKLIENALAHCRGVVGGPNGAAKRLGLATSTLQYRIKKFGIDPLNFVSRNNNWY